MNGSKNQFHWNKKWNDSHKDPTNSNFKIVFVKTSLVLAIQSLRMTIKSLITAMQSPGAATKSLVLIIQSL